MKCRLPERCASATIVILVILLNLTHTVLAPDSEAGDQPGGNIGIESTRFKINACEVWKLNGNTLDWGTGIPPEKDENMTNQQLDVGSSTYYFRVNISHDYSYTNITTVHVYGWFDYGDSSRESSSPGSSGVPEAYNKTPGKNLNFHLKYNATLNQGWKLWPDSDELNFSGVETRTISATTKEVAFKVVFGNQIRWAPGPPNGFTAAPGFNDLFTWNIFCDAYSHEGTNASPKGKNEFGTYKLTTLNITGSPMGSAPPGSALRMLQWNNPQEVDYSSNAPYTLHVRINNLTGPGGVLSRENIAITGEEIQTSTFFPQDSGILYLRGHENDTWENFHPSVPVYPSGRYSTAMAYDSGSDRVILFGGYDGSHNYDTWAYDFNTNTWTNMNPATSPSPRRGHAMAYDSESDRVILFGGYNGVVALQETWAYDFNTNTWTNMNPGTKPGARYLHAMAYDSESDRVILFGGYVGSSYKNDTWVYDFNTNTWTDVNPSIHPGQRDYHAMAYDSESDRVILFGGYDGTNYLSDTWAYDFNTNTWTNMNPGYYPQLRYGHAMTYDSQSDRIILFGGWYTGSYLSDIWAYNFNINLWTNMKPNVEPAGRYQHAMAYDSESKVVIMAEGSTAGGRSNEVWAYNYSSTLWVYLNPPLRGRAGHTMSYDWKNRLMVMAGGYNESLMLDDTWGYDAGINMWRYLAPWVQPEKLRFAAMDYDVSQGMFALFGGINETSVRKNDTWIYDPRGNIWTKRPPPSRPSARYSHAMAYDSESDRVILFGGSDGMNYLSDTWAYDYHNNTWTNMNPRTGPSARRDHAMIYDSESDRVILFGGYGNSGYLSDTWAYDFNTNQWVRMLPVSSPSSRRDHAMVYDSRRDIVILFGGYNGGSLRDTWTYDYNTNTWKNKYPATQPSSRYMHAMAYDSESDRVILFGGYGSLDDTWAYDFSTNNWTQMNPSPRPVGRYDHTMVYDSESDRVILFGGYPGYLYDTWTYNFNTNTWMNMNPSSLPPGRSGHAQVYIPKRDRAIIFGGGISGGSLSDTWAYDLNANTWMNRYPVVPSYPPARYGHGMAYDISNRKFFMFGGYTGTQYYNDLWVYNLSEGSWSGPYTPAPAPSPRYKSSFCYDTDMGRFLLFGGRGASGLLNDLWAFYPDSYTWVNITPVQSPPKREGASMVYDISDGRALLFGGKNESAYLNDTWVFSSKTNQWKKINTTIYPAKRESAIGGFHIHLGKVIITMGASASLLNDTWGFTGMDWRVNNEGRIMFHRLIYWYVRIPFGQAEGSYTSTITYTLTTSENPVTR